MKKVIRTVGIAVLISAAIVMAKLLLEFYFERSRKYITVGEDELLG